MKRYRGFWSVLLSYVLMGAGCSPAQSAGTDARRPAAPNAPSPDVGDTGNDQPPALASSAIALVEAGTYGPYLARRPDSTIAVWATPAEETPIGWYTARVDAATLETSQALRLGDAPTDLELIVVRPAGSGFVVLSTQSSGPVEMMLLGPAGELRNGPKVVLEPSERIFWVEAMPTSSGIVLLWAMRRGDRADVIAQLVTDAGELVDQPKAVLRDAKAWQATPLGDGVAIGAVKAEIGQTSLGPVEMATLDAKGRVTTGNIGVHASTTARYDLDMASVGDHVLLSWSDLSQLDSHVMLAAVDAKGQVDKPPFVATGPVGEQALVKLVPPHAKRGPAYLVWQELWDRTDRSLGLRAAALAPDAVLSERQAEIDAQTDDVVDLYFAASRRGLAALTVAPPCARDRTCDAPPVPVFVELDAQLEPLGTEPVRLAAADGGLAALAWGLQCEKQCLGLSALGSSPAPVYAVQFETKSTAWAEAAHVVKAPKGPKPLRAEVLAEVDPVADVAATAIDGEPLFGWVTYFDPTTPYQRLTKPAPDGRFDPPRALLQARGASAKEATTISLRARSLGGVALAPGRPGNGEALMVWAAVNNQQPQLFATLLDKTGRRKQQRMMTRSNGEVLDVAAEYVGNAWLVAWVDEREADPELYVTKLDRALVRRAPERRLTSQPGAATGPAMLARGDQTFVVWADAREGLKTGLSDIYLLRLKNLDASPLSEAQRLVRTQTHSHSPTLAPYGADGAVVAWVETNPEAVLASEGPGVMMGRLDAEGRFVEPPLNIKPLTGAATSVALFCENRSCRAVMSVDTGGAGELEAITWQQGSAPVVTRLGGLSGPANQAVAPVLMGDKLVYSDQVGAGSARIRELFIDWGGG